MADLSSILGGMVQGFKDFGTGLVDFFGTGAANIGDIASSIATGRATTKNQDDFRKWLYQTDDTQDAAAKGLGTILNGVSTVADVMPGAQAVTANPLFNGLQGAIGGVSDELKMAGKDADWGRAAQRAGVGAASGLASAYAGQGLAKTGNKLLSNGLTRGAISGALGGGIANAGYTGIEGGSVQDMINAGLYGAQTGALVGGTTGLARELIKPAHKMDVALTDDEKAARIANIDDQLGKLDLSTPEGNARYAELTAARENYEPKTYYHGSPATDITEFDINRAGKNTRSGEKAIYFTDTPEAAEEFAYERIPTDSIFMDKVGKRGGVYEANLDMRNTLDLDNLTDAQIRELWNYASPLGQLDGQEAFVQRLTDWRDKYHNPQLTKGYIDLEALRNSPYDSFSATMYPNTDNKAREYAIFDASKAKITKSPKTVADLMNEPDFQKSKIREQDGKLKTVYHGTDADFDKFGEVKTEPGYWFTEDKDYAASHGKNLKTANLNIENPLDLTSTEGDNKLWGYLRECFGDNVSEDSVYTKKFRNFLENKGYDGMIWDHNGKNTYVAFDPSQIKTVKAPQKTVADLMLSPEQEEYFKNSQARDASGNLKKLYHGSANGEFDTFSKEFANAENDWGKGFYFTDNEADVKKNYYDGGPDFDNKIARRAEQLEAELDIPYEQAEKQARNELYKGAYQIDAYTNLENPATVGKTVLFDGSEYPIKNLSDYDGDTEGYYQDLIYDLTDNVLADTDTDYRYHDDLMRTLYDAYAEGGVEPQRLKEMLNELEITDDNGNLVGNEIARSVIQNLGFDGIIDPTVANKFKNMGIDQNTTHYIAFEPNQIKSVKNKKPTKSANINYGLAGLLGTGGLAAALAAATPKDDKKKKSEVK